MQRVREEGPHRLQGSRGVKTVTRRLFFPFRPTSFTVISVSASCVCR